MANGGKCNYGELERFRKQLGEIADPNSLEQFFNDCANEIAMLLLRRVKKLTPVGKSLFTYEDVRDENGNSVLYKRGKKKGQAKQKRVNAHTGGTLRRSWYIDEVKKVGACYQIWIVNPVKYASYVEYGHRQTPGRFVPVLGKRLKKNWVNGRFMLTVSEIEIRRLTPALLQRRLKEYLNRCFRV